MFFSYTNALNKIADARVFGGTHFLTSCFLGNTLGQTVADDVIDPGIARDRDDPNDDQDRARKARIHFVARYGA